MILLIRHGETEWNVHRRLQGHRDSPLTAKGLRQAQAVAGLVGDLVAREAGAWRLITSPLGRALTTAEAIAAATGLPLETDERLMEVSCGAGEGRVWDDVDADPALADAPRDWLFGHMGGESHEQVRARAESFLAALEPEPGRRVIAVSHGITGRVLRRAYARLEGLDGYEHVPQDAVFRLQNGQIDRFDCEPVD